MFLYKIFFSRSSILSIPIMIIGINGGYFPATFWVCLMNSQRKPLNGYYLGALLFTIQRIWIVLGRCLFLSSVHTFSWFLKSNWSSGFGHAETGGGAKRRVFCGVNFFRSNFKVEWENGVWTKIRFIGSGLLFTCGNFTLIFTVFSIFWIGFFLSGFPNPFTAHSRPNFLFELNFNVSLVVFCSHAAFWHWFFRQDLFLNVFPNPFIVHSRSSFVQSMEILWIVRLDLSCYVF